MVAHRLVEIHVVQDGSVESCEQFLRDNKDFGFIRFPDEVLPDFLFFFLVDVQGLELLSVAMRWGEHHTRVVMWEVLVECLLVECTSLTVNRDKESFEAHRLDVLPEMVSHKA